MSEDDIVVLDELSARLAAGTYYEALGVRRDASRAEIRDVFFALSKRFHPDRFFRSDLGARQAQIEQVFAGLSRAYETLSRSAVRRMYDAQLEEDLRETDPVPRSAAGPVVEEAPAAPPPPVQPPAPPRQPRAPRKPSAHVLKQLAARVRAREAETAAKHQSVVPPAGEGGATAASALARELMQNASKAELRRRGHLREAEVAERRRDWGEAYRCLALAQRMTPGDIELIRRMEHAHREWMVQQVPDNTEAARAAEAAGKYGEAALLWARVADATDALDAHVAAARSHLRQVNLHEKKKAGRFARRASELGPRDVRAQKVLLDFFEAAGMERSAERQRELVEALKRKS